MLAVIITLCLAMGIFVFPASAVVPGITGNAVSITDYSRDQSYAENGETLWDYTASTGTVNLYYVPGGEIRFQLGLGAATRTITVNNNGATIIGGSASATCTVKNGSGSYVLPTGRRVICRGKITGGTFKGTVTNNTGCTISGGTFSATSTVNNSGTISGGTFTKNVTNYGTVTDGAFDIVITGEFNNHGSVTGGTFTGNTPRNSYDGTISGGTFNVSNFINNGTVCGTAVISLGGLFNNTSVTVDGVTYYPTVCGETHINGNVVNYGYMTGNIVCRFAEFVNYQEISGGKYTFDSTVQNGGSTAHWGFENRGIITGEYDEQGESVNSPEFTLSGGKVLKNYNETSSTDYPGVIEAGEFHCPVLNDSKDEPGVINGGNFYERVANGTDNIINDGVFQKAVTNSGIINGGVFYSIIGSGSVNYSNTRFLIVPYITDSIKIMPLQATAKSGETVRVRISPEGCSTVRVNVYNNASDNTVRQTDNYTEFTVLDLRVQADGIHFTANLMSQNHDIPNPDIHWERHEDDDLYCHFEGECVTCGNVITREAKGTLVPLTDNRYQASYRLNGTTHSAMVTDVTFDHLDITIKRPLTGDPFDDEIYVSGSMDGDFTSASATWPKFGGTELFPDYEFGVDENGMRLGYLYLNFDDEFAFVDYYGQDDPTLTVYDEDGNELICGEPQFYTFDPEGNGISSGVMFEFYVKETERGDANLDGEIDVRDLIALKKHLAAWENYTNRMDILPSGAIDSNDVVALQRILLDLPAAQMVGVGIFLDPDDEYPAAGAELIAGTTGWLPAEPARDGYLFGGWYQDRELSVPYDPSVPITQTFNIFACWIPA